MQKGKSLELGEDSPAYCIFGAETLLKRIAELETQIGGAKNNEDIEYIHKLRVASRRLRTSLTVFEECLPKKRIKAWKKAVKTLTTSCGEARDQDVLIAYLQNYVVNLEPRAAVGIEYLLKLQKASRLLMQSDVVNVLDSLQQSRILADLSDLCRTIKIGNGDEPVNIRTLSTYAKARDCIVARLTEFLALSRYVHDKSAIAKHHELRIAAKRLRYTMEIFSPIYSGGLKDQIALMKQFQDILGEMHDYYVWSQDLRAHGQEIPADAKYGVDRLLIYLQQERASRYRDFVLVWDETKAKGLFNEIKEVTDIRPNGGIVQELLNRERKAAVISDIHGNLDALKAVVKNAEKSGFEVFLNAGDAVGFGIYPSEVIGALRSPIFLNVLGNVDLEILDALRVGKVPDGDVAKDLAIKELSPSDVAYLQSLPRELRFEIAGTRVLLTHGSPDSVDEHIYPDSAEERLKEIAAKAEADVVITGHTHLQMNRSIDGVTFVNPGSVGRPVNGEPKAEYALVSFNPLKVDFRSVSYDIETLAGKMRKERLPESHVQVLLRAAPLKAIEKQERVLARKALWKRRSTIRKVMAIAKNYLPDESHTKQDSKLALMLFNATRRITPLGTKERYWLECAAILHDIGRSKGDKKHHRHSLDLILNDQTLPFTLRERYIIGSIARYHRKALPAKKHFNLAPLSRAEEEKVEVLSAILRLADALDYSHRSVVKKINLKFSPDEMILECFFTGQHYLEDQSAKKRKDLFDRVFKKNLTIVWRPQQITTPLPDKVRRTPVITENPPAVAK